MPSGPQKNAAKLGMLSMRYQASRAATSAIDSAATTSSQSVSTRSVQLGSAGSSTTAAAGPQSSSHEPGV